MRQRTHCRTQGRLRFIFPFKLRLDGWRGVGKNNGLASRAAYVAADKIESDGAHSGIKQPAVRNIVVPPPELDESFLDNVFRVGS